jgi:hypothetical protein
LDDNPTLANTTFLPFGDQQIMLVVRDPKVSAHDIQYKKCDYPDVHTLKSLKFLPFSNW